MQNLKFYPFLPFILCLITDVVLFSFDYTYRYIFYESALCLIFFKNRFINAILFSTVLLLKFLFLYFGINIFSLYWFTLEPLFISAVVIALSISAICFSKHISLLYFLAFVVTTVFFDKQKMADQLATSILKTSYDSAVVRPVTQIDSAVHKKLLKSLMNRPTIFINWESLGIPRDPQILSKLQQHHPKLKFEAIKLSPRATIASEFEYLCGLTFGKIDEQLECLPSKYSSIALHGNFGSFLNRKNTYQSFGFQRSKFMHSIVGKACFYSFRGKCDAAVFKNVIELAQSESAEFIYALTLDSHFPYAKYDNHAKEVWQEVDDFLVALKKETFEYNLIIVGDHPPPFASEFYRDQVPLIYLQN